MSMYFDNHVVTENEQCMRSEWSKNESNLVLAVATDKPRIIFMSDEGTIMPNFEIQRGKNAIVQMKWHPIIHSLAIGWEDGCITLWHEDDRLTRDEKVRKILENPSFLIKNLNLIRIFALECPQGANFRNHIQRRRISHGVW